jgi:hypothetical protein
MSKDKEKSGWLHWLEGYGADKFYDAFLHNAQGAESKCVHCHLPIYLDIVEGGGVPDWKTQDGDYGCDKSPETTNEGTGGHFPKMIQEMA